jgi:hypothetical protein
VRLLAPALLVLTLCSARAEAQTDSVLTRALTDTLRLLGRLSPDSNPTIASPVELRMIRLGSATGGFMFGMLLGGFAGHEIEAKNCRGDCRTPIGEALLTGGAIGGALGAAIGAAFLDLGSHCRFRGRILRTMAGSAVGASAFFAATGGLEKRRGRSAFFVPLGSVGGSLGSLGRCWKSSFH